MNNMYKNELKRYQDAKPNIPVSASPPTSPQSDDIWINSTDLTINIYKDSKWEKVTRDSAYGQVTSVSGRTGDVVLTSTDVGLGNVVNESKSTLFNNTTFTGNTTGVNWIGDVHGIKYTVSNVVPTTANTDDIWIDTANRKMKHYDGTAWELIAENEDIAGITVGMYVPSKVDPNVLYEVFVGAENRLNIRETSVVPPTTWNPLNDARLEALEGRVIQGIVLPTASAAYAGSTFHLKGADNTAETVSLIVSLSEAPVDGNVIVTLSGVAHNVAILATDDILGIASKIGLATYTGWSTTTNLDTITFISTTFGNKPAPAFDGAAVNVSGTFTTVVEGKNSIADLYYICLKDVANNYTWIDIGSTTANLIAHKSEFDVLESDVIAHKADMVTQLALKANKTQVSQSQPTLVNGWASLNTVQYYKDEFGVVHVTGRINNGTTTEGTSLFTLNEGNRPPATIFRNSVTYSTTTDATPCVFQINTSGVVTLAFASKAVIIIDFSFRV